LKDKHFLSDYSVKVNIFIKFLESLLMSVIPLIQEQKFSH
jgi:hypothetical protein